MINPELHPFLSVWAEKWARVPAGSTPADRRAAFEDIAAEMRLPTPDGVTADKEHHIDSVAGSVRVRVFRPAGSGVRPALIYMHGGAWMQGSPETHWDITARLADWAGVVVVSVDYAKAPERPFPAAFEQVRAVAMWLAAHAGDLKVDPARIAIGGDSAGGNLAAAVALDLRGQMTFAGQLLIYPACDFDKSRPSYAENPDGPIIATKGMEGVNRAYCPDTALLTSDPRVAPLLAASHAGLPPAYVAVAEHDPLRDSGLAYADALDRAGVPVTLDRGPGLIHGYLRAMAYCADSETSLRAMAAWLARMTAA